MTRAYSKAAKRAQKRAGRPMIEDAIRLPSGRLSRSRAARTHMTLSEERMTLEAATWKRRQANPELTVHEARGQEHGSVISAWLAAHEKWLSANKDRPSKEPNQNEFTQTHYDAAERFQRIYEDYQRALSSRRCRSSSDFTGSGGFDGADPFAAGRAERDLASEQAYRDARRILLEMENCPLALMALETIVIENNPAHTLLPDLRCALNRLARLWKWGGDS